MFDRSAGAVGWDSSLPAGANVVGGALAPGKFYVATADGVLYALGEMQETAQ